MQKFKKIFLIFIIILVSVLMTGQAFAQDTGLEETAGKTGLPNH